MQISIHMIPMFVCRQNVGQFRIELFFEVTDYFTRLFHITNVKCDELIGLRLLYNIPNIVWVELVEVKVRQESMLKVLAPWFSQIYLSTFPHKVVFRTTTEKSFTLRPE